MTGDRRRVPYFERPRPPHDWRWWVGLVGRSMIVLGLLVFAFVGYQLWGTGIRTAQAQDRLDQQFEAALASTTSTVTTTSSTVPGDTVPDTTPTTSVGGSAVAPYTGPIADGTPVARLRIPAIDLDWTVVEGVTADALEDGPGHFPETPMPGQFGNAAIAGHRTTHGEPFRRLDRLVPGDPIEVTTLAGIFTYTVTGTEIVLPTEYGRVIPTTDATRATLVLATCHPAFSTKQRLIVHAELDPTLSGEVLLPPSVTSTIAPDTTAPDTTAPDSTTPDSGAGPDTTALSTTTIADGLGDGLGDGAGDGTVEADAFTEGWFHDTAAWPHVIAWGALLCLVVVGAYWAGRSARRLTVSVATGVAPFVVVLYFFFENVARLLPPGL